MAGHGRIAVATHHGRRVTRNLRRGTRIAMHHPVLRTTQLCAFVDRICHVPYELQQGAASSRAVCPCGRAGGVQVPVLQPAQEATTRTQQSAMLHRAWTTRCHCHSRPSGGLAVGYCTRRTARRAFCGSVCLHASIAARGHHRTPYSHHSSHRIWYGATVNTRAPFHPTTCFAPPCRSVVGSRGRSVRFAG